MPAQIVLLVSICLLLVPSFIVCPVPDVSQTLAQVAVKQLVVELVLSTNPAPRKVLVMLVTPLPHLHPILLLMLVLPVPLHVLPV